MISVKQTLAVATVEDESDTHKRMWFVVCQSLWFSTQNQKQRINVSYSLMDSVNLAMAVVSSLCFSWRQEEKTTMYKARLG